MRFFYIDPGLRDNVGHHANTCRTITHELRRRGIETHVAASGQITPALQTELGAVPFFRFFTYWTKNEDSIGGWLSVYEQGVATTLEDLERLPQLACDDVVYLNSAQPAQLMALVEFLSGLSADRRPRAVVEFGTDAGIEVIQNGDSFEFIALDPREDARAVLYRHIGTMISDEIRDRLHLTTFDRVASLGYEFLLRHKVGVLPFPQEAYAPPRRKVGKRPFTVGVLGHQRRDKGYHLMPSVLPVLLSRHPEIMILAHNAAPEQMPEVQQAVRALGGLASRVIIDERPADKGLWRYLLAGTDLMLCPYDPTRFTTAYSAMAVEAVANGIPLVVPGDTSLSRFVVEHGSGGAVFNAFEATAIADAASLAITNFDRLAEQAYTAAETWNRQDRKAMLVNTILG